MRTNKTHFAAPNPSLVFLITVVKGSCNPPVTPIRSPSDHPIIANIRNPRLLEPKKKKGKSKRVF